MPARSQFAQLATKFGMLFGVLFVVTVLLAAMPGHHAPAAQQESQQPPATQLEQQSQGMDPPMAGMDMDEAKASEAHAVHDMTPGQPAHNAHMHTTGPRPQAPEDLARAREIVDQLRDGIE